MSETMLPLEAITADPPNVWLTSFYGFDPEDWGYLGFSTNGQRNGFIKRSRPGALVVVYNSLQGHEDYGRVVGVLQVSHRTNHAKQFMSPKAWVEKEQNTERAEKWNLGVKATRAWRVEPDDRPLVAEFADSTYRSSRGQAIGSQGMKLETAEAEKLLAMRVREVPVYGERTPLSSEPILFEDLVPSRQGPVAQNAFWVPEAEGPKHLYILRLAGDLDHYLGTPAAGCMIVKPGMSKVPSTRCDALNKAYPPGAYWWELLQTSETYGPAFPTSDAAKAGELEMQKVLQFGTGRSLGREFFLADADTIDGAWTAGLKAAEKAS